MLISSNSFQVNSERKQKHNKFNYLGLSPISEKIVQRWDFRSANQININGIDVNQSLSLYHRQAISVLIPLDQVKRLSRNVRNRSPEVLSFCGIFLNLDGRHYRDSLYLVSQNTYFSLKCSEWLLTARSSCDAQPVHMWKTPILSILG